MIARFICFLFLLSLVEKRDDCSFHLFLFLVEFSWEERWLLVLFVFCFCWVQSRREMIARFICFCFWLSSVEKRDDCLFYLFLFLFSLVEKRDDCSFYLFLFNHLSSWLNSPKTKTKTNKRSNHLSSRLNSTKNKNK
jgi:hypothetical protein